MSASTNLVLLRGRACLQCRSKRKKCDAAKPVCGPCMKSASRGKICTYRTQATTTKVDTLTARVDKLDAGIRDLRSTLIPVAGSEPSSSSSFFAAAARKSPMTTVPPRVLRPGPLDVPVSLRDPTVTLFKQKHLHSKIRDALVNVFVGQCQSTYFTEWNVDRFWATYKLPPSDPESLHPAMLDAMCLLACLHGPLKWRSYEPLFWARLQRSLYDSLANADRLLDFIRASALGAVYCLVKGRYVEGQNRFSVITHFAVVCGLHQIDTYDLASLKVSPLIRRPRDLVDLGDLIYVWWYIFCCDRIAAMLMKSPATISQDDKTVTTMWPCALSDYANEHVTATVCSGLSTAWSLDPRTMSENYDNVYTFQTKGFAILYYAAALAAHTKEGEGSADDIDTVIRGVSLLSDSMKLYRQRVCPNLDHLRKEEGPGHDEILVLAMTLVYAGLIQLYNMLPNQDTVVYTKRLEVARACACLAAEASGVSPKLLHVIIHLPWNSAYEVLAWEYIQLIRSNDKVGAADVRADLDGLMDSYKIYAQYYYFKPIPLVHEQISRFKIHTNEFTQD
ncbi:hypothetical protein BOTBODRAFT_184143 [Botryobasidium botryosum FD-172 SS1]|uniref:Zn(2)-C6 fungal-type domain-containing protein n=1 Tax=Botryobasidium botryosum (strain FD-172 SS1) TaxID=930990 RepID=A0A067MX35_BOTB1|nr:hypothetical protein BOTBODRAFT_184143 [Botryobasidium botryosum FD-172 SS1]